MRLRQLDRQPGRGDVGGALGGDVVAELEEDTARQSYSDHGSGT